ncbi:MAG: TonB-dependent receptor [Steroidobacteraceae bacterium]
MNHKPSGGLLRAAVTAALSMAAGGALADDASATGDGTLDTLIVTGTRAIGRTVESSVAPIDVLPAAEIASSNKDNLLETLNTLLPSFNLPNVATPDIGSMIRGGQIRGLNPDHVLVLINGKRRHTTAFLGAGGFSTSAPADLSLIPSGTIGRIEVLRDGASALYGSDAIAGVINIITDKSVDDSGVSVRYGQTGAGDGGSTTAQAHAGFRLGEQGYLHLAGQVDDRKLMVRNSPVPSTFLFYFPLNAQGQQIAPTGNPSNPRLPAGATPNPKEASRNNNAWINQGAAPFRLYALTADLGAPVNDAVEAYATLTGARRESSAPQNFRHPSRDEVIRAFYPDGFTPVEAIEERDYEAVGGLRHDGGKEGWSWDLSTGYGHDSVDVYTRNSENPTYGLQSQRDFYDGNLTYGVWTSNLDLRRPFSLGSVPAEFSTGLEYRAERYTRGQGDLQSWSHGPSPILDGPNAGQAYGAGVTGAQALPGFRPDDEVDQHRNGKSVYVGVSLNPVQPWTIDLAGRYEDYSDFGDTATGRVSTRYDLGGIGLRATASTGFRAPPLAALAYKNTANINTYLSHVLQVDSPEAIALGAQPLKPEKSTNYTVGFVAKIPRLRANLALDVYQIDLKDRIGSSPTIVSNAQHPGSAALLAAAGFATGDQARYFANTGDSRTRGVEITLDGLFNFDAAGRLNWSLATSRNYQSVTRVAPTPAVLAADNYTNTNNINATLSPGSKEVLSLRWTLGGWSVGARETHYGAITRSGTVPSGTGPNGTNLPNVGETVFYDIGGLWITDLDGGYQYNPHLRFSLAATNVFGTKPSKLPAVLLSPSQSYAYTNNGPIGAAGAFYSATVEYKW